MCSFYVVMIFTFIFIQTFGLLVQIFSYEHNNRIKFSIPYNALFKECDHAQSDPDIRNIFRFNLIFMLLSYLQLPILFLGFSLIKVKSHNDII